MTSRTSETGEVAVVKDSSPLPVSDSGVSNGSSLCLSDGGAVSSEQVMELSSTTSDGTLTQNALFLKVEEVMEKGLSCLSLEVCASADNLFMLNQDDLSESSCGSGPGSGPGSVERVGLNVASKEVWLGESGADGGVPRIVLDGHQEVLPLQSSHDAETCGEAGKATKTPTSSSGSRSSSSMGYLEPRPTINQPPANPWFLTPKDIQKHLLKKITSLNTPSENTCNKEEEAETRSEMGIQVVSALPTSRSSQSLNQTVSGSAQRTSLSLGTLFQRKRASFGSKEHAHHIMAASSTSGLILHHRPKTLPAKTAAEEKKHQQLHQQMMSAARKKELLMAKDEMKKEKLRRQRDKQVADSIKEWERILPNWESLHNTRKVRDLWWLGLPPGIRGKVWKKAIGNDLNISSDLYVINLRRCKERLASPRERSESNSSRTSVNREHSVEVIHLDVLRTFPTLGFFQDGGPYNKSLHDVLGAYACYRPDIGYVQGMSFLAAVLLLNMEAADAFICLANLLNLPSYMAFFKVDHSLMWPYFNTFQILLQDSLPKLSAHFFSLSFSPEYYLIEWIFTIYTRTLPLDIACRVWDMFCRDGESFLFKTALGILKLFQSDLLECRSLEDLGQFLGKLPTVDSDIFFPQIESVHFTAKKFKHILLQGQRKPASDSSTTQDY